MIDNSIEYILASWRHTLDFMNSINISLAELREKYRFTQKKMAEELCCSRRMYQRYENGDFELPEAQQQLLQFKIPHWEELYTKFVDK